MPRTARKAWAAFAIGILCGMAADGRAQVPPTHVDLEAVWLPLPDPGSYREVVIDDIDGDGSNELVVVGVAARISVYSVDELGGLLPLHQIPLPAGRDALGAWVSPTVVDVDGDGDRDLMAWWRANNRRGILDVAYRHSTGYHIQSYETPETDAGYRMASADFDGDGLQDVLTVDHGFSAPTRLFVLYNDLDPGLRFTRYDAFAFDGARESTGAYVYDIDGDGRVDIAVTTHDAGPKGVRLLFGDLARLDLDPGDQTRSSSIGFGDLDGDGGVDLVTNASVPHDSRDFLWLYRQVAPRSFQPASALPTSGDRPKMPTFVDLDGDGLEELVVSVTDDRTVDVFGRDGSGRIAGPPLTLSGPLLAAVDHGATTNPNSLVAGDVDNDGDTDLLIGQDGTVWLRNRSNRPPTAVCSDQVVAADEACLGAVEVGAESFDPDGDEVVVSQSPPGPYPLGEHRVTVRVTDTAGAVSECSAMVRVEDVSPPILSCGSVATVTPPDAPMDLQAEATDNCGWVESAVDGYDCVKTSRRGRRIDKTESCILEVSGDTVEVVDTGGVGTRISWRITATDENDNEASLGCVVEVVHPADG